MEWLEVGLKSSRRHYRRGAALLLAPYLLGALFLVAVPLLLTLILAFFNYNGLNPPTWAGWANLRELRSDPLMRRALGNSISYIYLATPLRLAGALGLALLFSNPRPGTGIYRALVYLPTVVPEVAYALLWLWILNPLYGPLNQGLRLLGLPAPAWLVEQGAALPALVMMALFTIGESFVILLAALKSIPGEVYDAAWVDGGGRWQIFQHITLPLLLPWLVLLLFRDVILSLQSTFTPAYIMTGGGPYYATLFLPMLALEEAFDRMRFGLGAGVTLLIILITAGLLALLYGLFQEWGYEEE
jgi:multiple sugar transport system permease protein